MAWDAEGRVLPAWWQLAGTEVHLRVDDHSARYPLTIDPVIEQARLTASDGAARDFFGRSVTVSDDTVVVGALLDDIGANTDQGSAYVFVKPPGGGAGAFTESAKLTASDGAFSDGFGQSIAMSGETVVAGAPGRLGGNSSQGAAYVFVKPGGGWTGALNETAKLTASDGATLDGFGFVAVSGDTVVAAAADIGGNSLQGAAYVFVKPAGGWAGALNETAKLTASDGAARDFFGHSVAVSGDTVVVGAEFDSGASAKQGSAYVFVKPDAGWAGALNESAKLTASDATENDDFGSSVAVNGDTVFVGARFGGSAYVFVKAPGGWAGALTETAQLIASDGAGGIWPPR